jgi:NADPH2:quinone reductase
MVLGQEGAGVVEAIGPGVSEVKVGDRVVYQGILGGYAEMRTIKADRLLPIPAGVDDKIAAAVCLKGLTAFFLLRRTFKVGAGTTLLFHAAAGGVGTIATQWAKALGATVIGTVGSPEKAKLAASNGCDHVINYRTEDFVARVREITNDEKCDVVYDSVGKDTFPGSLDSLKPLGMWVSFGQSSGPPPAFPILLLLEKGSIFATRPTINHYLAKRADLLAAAGELFARVADGTIRVDIGQEFALKDAAKAHVALAGRETTGATVLIP